jgi:hypothetical protein
MFSIIGSSSGAIVFSILLNKLINGPVGFAWGVRSSAFIILGMLVIANTVMSPGDTQSHGERKEMSVRMVLLDTPYTLGIAGYALIRLLWRTT